MAFVRFACFLLVVLPVTSLSMMKFHQGYLEDKDAAQDSFASIEKETLSNNNIGGRRLGVRKFMVMESSSKSLGRSGFDQEKISKKMVFSSSNSNGEISGKKKRKISRLEIRKKLGSGSSIVYNNADYLTHMHHPPKHN